MAVKNFWLDVWRRDSSQKLLYILENPQKNFGVNTTKLRPGTFKKPSPFPKTGLLESESLFCDFLFFFRLNFCVKNELKLLKNSNFSIFDKSADMADINDRQVI